MLDAPRWRFLFSFFYSSPSSFINTPPKGWIPIKSRGQKEQIKEILDTTKQDFSDVQIGRTMALYRAPQQRVMELLRNLALERVCLVVQRWLRGCFARRFRFFKFIFILII